MATKANDRQVGGDHYKKHGETGEQHWDRQWRLNGPGYFIGCITKYVERYRDKNGIQDLEKARHFLDKLIELEETETGKVKAVEIAPCEHDFHGVAYPIGSGVVERCTKCLSIRNNQKESI